MLSFNENFDDIREIFVEKYLRIDRKFRKHRGGLSVRPAGIWKAESFLAQEKKETL